MLKDLGPKGAGTLGFAGSRNYLPQQRMGMRSPSAMQILPSIATQARGVVPNGPAPGGLRSLAPRLTPHIAPNFFKGPRY